MQPESKPELEPLSLQLTALWRDAMQQSESLVRSATYGPQLGELMSELRLQLELLQQQVLAQHVRLTRYAQDAPALLQRTVTFYQELHVRAQQLTGPETPNDGVTRAAVPIDPQSALCTIQCPTSEQEFVEVCARLHSENESILKYAPTSTLAQRRGIEEKLQALWQFYTEQCDALYDALELASECDTEEQTALVTRLVLRVTRHLVDNQPSVATPQLTRLHDVLRLLVPAADAMIDAMRDEQQACTVMRDNVLARLACCAQLYSNLTKPYRLHQSRLLPAGHASIF